MRERWILDGQIGMKIWLGRACSLVAGIHNDITVVSTPAPKSSMATPLRRAYGKARLVSGERVLLAAYHSLFIFSTMGA